MEEKKETWKDEVRKEIFNPEFVRLVGVKKR